MAVLSCSCQLDCTTAWGKRAEMIFSGFDRAYAEQMMLPPGSTSKWRSTYTRCCSRAKSERFFIAMRVRAPASHLCTHLPARKVKGNAANNTRAWPDRVSAHHLVHGALTFVPGDAEPPQWASATFSRDARNKRLGFKTGPKRRGEARIRHIPLRLHKVKANE